MQAGDSLKIVVMTSGSQLVLPILRRVVSCPELQPVGIIYDLETDRPRRSMRRRLLSVWKYKGPHGLLKGIYRRLPGVSCRTGDNRNARVGMSLREFATAYSIPLHVTGNIHDGSSIEFLRSRNADLGLVIGARLLKRCVFEVPRMGSINIHQGIIPDYRGGGSVFWPLFNGEKELGVSVHRVVAEVDSGALYVQKRMALNYDCGKYGSRYKSFVSDVAPKLDRLAIEAVVETLRGIAGGVLRPTPVDTSRGKRYRRPTHKERRMLRKRLVERDEGAKPQD